MVFCFLQQLNATARITSFTDDRVSWSIHRMIETNDYRRRLKIYCRCPLFFSFLLLLNWHAERNGTPFKGKKNGKIEMECDASCVQQFYVCDPFKMFNSDRTIKSKKRFDNEKKAATHHQKGERVKKAHTIQLNLYNSLGIPRFMTFALQQAILSNERRRKKWNH